jgi:hypothetical protein
MCLRKQKVLHTKHCTLANYMPNTESKEGNNHFGDCWRKEGLVSKNKNNDRGVTEASRGGVLKNDH